MSEKCHNQKFHCPPWPFTKAYRGGGLQKTVTSDNVRNGPIGFRQIWFSRRWQGAI
jgi:hypothetical protein